MEYKLVNFCEFDKFASKSYCAIHNVSEDLNLGDITKVDETSVEEFNMICGGSPCQDFSIAGKREGSKWICKDCGFEYNPLTVHYDKRDVCPNCNGGNLDKTRSSLLVEWLRIIRANKPNFGIYENVKNIVGEEFKETTFRIFERELNNYGYNTYWRVLNAKDYGIPQNRERVYLILIRKDVDNGKFKFPDNIPLEYSAKDFIENNVERKYYFSDRTLNHLTLDNIQRYGFANKKGINKEKNIASCLYAGMWRGMCNQGIDVIKEPDGFRKLTPRECFKLMGFEYEDCIKCENAGISNSQLYKQAGNSIVVNVLYYILLELKNAMPYLFEDIKLSSFFSGIGAFEKALDRL